MGILRALFYVLIAVLVVSGAVSNSFFVTLKIWPIPYELETRFFVVFLLVAGVMFVFGRMAGALERRSLRKELKEARRKTEALLPPAASP